MSRTPIVIVQGAQYGSEAKGMVAAALCERRDIRYAVRTGAVNAGHTVYYKGKKYVNQQLPTGWVNPKTRLVLGAGAYINPFQLHDEIEMIHEATGCWPSILVDYRAGLHLTEHTERAKQSNRHYKIGATGKGCSEAILDRIRLRGSGGMLFMEWCDRNHGMIDKWKFSFGDMAEFLNDAYDRGDSILLEGTQGTLLDLYLGPYPYTTHKQCTASQWVTEAGLSPSLEYEIVLVARTFPIRVAGNSGPLPGEISWPELMFEVNEKLRQAGKPFLVDPKAGKMFLDEWKKLGEYPYASPEVEASERNRDTMRALPPDVVEELGKLFEFTTVTKKLRRVARLNMPLLKYSCKVNRPAWVALTFLNYEFPELWGAAAPVTTFGAAMSFADDLGGKIGAPVRAVTTGPESKHFIFR